MRPPPARAPGDQVFTYRMLDEQTILIFAAMAVSRQQHSLATQGNTRAWGQMPPRFGEDDKTARSYFTNNISMLIR